MESFCQTVSEINLDDLLTSDVESLPSSVKAIAIGSNILQPSAETSSTGSERKIPSAETVEDARQRRNTEAYVVWNRNCNDIAALVEGKKVTFRGVDNKTEGIASTAAVWGVEENLERTGSKVKNSDSAAAIKKEEKQKTKVPAVSRAAHLERLDIEHKIYVLEQNFPGIATSAIKRALSESQKNATKAIDMLVDQIISGNFEARNYNVRKSAKKDFRGVPAGSIDDFRGVPTGPRKDREGKKREIFERAREGRRAAWKMRARIPKTVKSLGGREQKAEDHDKSFHVSKAVMEHRGISPAKGKWTGWRADQRSPRAKWLGKNAGGGHEHGLLDVRETVAVAVVNTAEGRESQHVAKGGAAENQAVKMPDWRANAAVANEERRRGKTGKSRYGEEKNFRRRMWKRFKIDKRRPWTREGDEKHLRPGVLMVV